MRSEFPKSSLITQVRNTFDTLRRNVNDTPFRSHTWERHSAMKCVGVPVLASIQQSPSFVYLLPHTCHVILALIYLTKRNIMKVDRPVIVRTTPSVNVYP